MHTCHKNVPTDLIIAKQSSSNHVPFQGVLISCTVVLSGFTPVQVATSVLEWPAMAAVQVAAVASDTGLVLRLIIKEKWWGPVWAEWVIKLTTMTYTRKHNLTIQNLELSSHNAIIIGHLINCSMLGAICSLSVTVWLSLLCIPLAMTHNKDATGVQLSLKLARHAIAVGE